MSGSKDGWDAIVFRETDRVSNKRSECGKNLGYAIRMGKPGGQKCRPSTFMGEFMSQNHYSTKPKRRSKNKKRKDSSHATMMKIRQLEADEKKK
jgi:hypothetical protein